MGTELRPLGVNCNIACLYCYQNPQRDARNTTRAYDIEAMKQAVLAHRSPFTLFGGEPLLMPLDDLEALWAWGLETFGQNSVQTNGTLITDDHVRLFQTYRVSVGISVDGPGELNDVRWHGSLEKTRAATAKTHAAIEQLCREMPDSPPSLIVTLHQKNAAAEHLPRMTQWFCELDRLGVPSARLHLLEVDHEDVQAHFALAPSENLRALETFWHLEDTSLERLRFDITSDMKALLSGEDQQVSCVWRSCDPYNTQAVRGVEGDGQSSNCGRTNKDGIDFPHADSMRYDRYVKLYQTPQAHGGCAGCRFFLMCKGHCPGTAIEGDWRNRTEHCSVWFNLFERLEAQLLADDQTPLSLDPRRIHIEQCLVNAWLNGDNPSLSDLLAGSNPQDANEQRQDQTGDALQPFIRRAWVSDSARDVWQPRLKRILDAWVETTYRFAAHSKRSLLIRLPAPHFFRIKGKAWQDGLRVSLLSDRTTSYAPAAHRSPVRGVVEYLAAIGPDDIIRHVEQAWAAETWDEAFEMLSVPACCRPLAIHARQHGIHDMMLAMAQHASVSSATPGAADVSGPLVNNVFWKRLGVTAIPHWPCEPDCTASEQMGWELLNFSREQRFIDECDWLEAILSWPVQWTSLHGIAEFKSPILKASMSTDDTAERWTLHRNGTSYPELGAQGIAFPYRKPAQPAYSDSTRVREGFVVLDCSGDAS